MRSGGSEYTYRLRLSTAQPDIELRVSPSSTTIREKANASVTVHVARRDGYAGPVTVEAYTVMHGRDGGREVALAACLLPDGRRAWCSTRDADTMATLIDEECCGRPAQRAASGSLRLD